MEFKSLKNIETSFRQIRLFGIVFLCLCALVSVFSVVASFRFAEKQREKIYVLDGGQVADAGAIAGFEPEPPRGGARTYPAFSRVVLYPLARPCGHREQHQPRAVPGR